jgi:phosphatidylglycerophosphatase GEP4
VLGWAVPRCVLCAGKEAEALEAALGIPVLRHREKKPAGGSGDMEQHFG